MPGSSTMRLLKLETISPDHVDRAYVTNVDVNPPSKEPSSSYYQYIKCDVRSWDEQLSVFKAAIANSPHNTIDIVIPNAAVVGNDPIFIQEDTDEPTKPDLRIIEVGFIGTAYTTKLALHCFSRLGEKSDRCLILKSSIAGYSDLLGTPSYQSMKYAVRGLMCGLRRSGLCRVNLIAPW